VTDGDVPIETEAVKQRLLHQPPFAHHRSNLLHSSRRESAFGASFKPTFSTQSVDSGRLASEKTGGPQVVDCPGPPLMMIGELPAYALDKHTALGKASIYCLSANARPSATRLPPTSPNIEPTMLRVWRPSMPMPRP